MLYIFTQLCYAFTTVYDEMNYKRCRLQSRYIIHQPIFAVDFQDSLLNQMIIDEYLLIVVFTESVAK